MAATSELTSKVNKNKVTLEFELDPKGRLSSTGKSNVHFTTGGFVEIEGSNGMKVSLSVIKKA